MSKTGDELNNRRCRVESGIYFDDDTAVLLDGSPKAGYTVTERTTVARLNASDPAGWVAADEVGFAISGAWTLSTCAGDWEGEGFLALRSTEDDRLRWLIHLDTSEPFTFAAVAGESVHAASGTYPDAWHWTIPIDTPWQLVVVRSDAA